ncbi:nucleoside hydrolase [Salmonella enterica subsp. enterica]|uniref:Nucleoside hydrolase n=1 Tax=Salmonella enterica I TaxID=59201 RepID=A0A612HD93_SALET|nr:nucleoside hydrolase [Salmonella enterica subsp. enterica]
METRMKVIIDTDPGVDDAFAICYASRCPELEIMGITTTYGNNHIRQTTDNACFLSRLFSIPTEVWQGSSRPLYVPLLKPGTTHGQNGLGDAFDVTPGTPAGNAVNFIINTVKKYPGEITLVTLGPLTNLATAINQAPEITGLIKQVVMMGGAFGHNGHRGNITPVAEYNIYCDPHAADLVFRENLPLTIVGLDVTEEVIVRRDELKEDTGKRYIHLLRQMADCYLDFSRDHEHIDGMRLHDALTISWLLMPEAFTVIHAPLRAVSDDGLAVGQTIYLATTNGRDIRGWSGNKKHTICTGVNADAVKQHFLDRIYS